MAKMFRCGFLAVFFSAAIFGQATLGGQQAQYDLLIRNGSIVDGTGNPWFAGDVGVRGDRIFAVGRLSGATAKREIDARGLVVAPGFIDLHTHSDQALLNDGNAESKVRQGVTVDVIGESTSVAPRDGLPDAKGTWTDFTGYWQALGQKGISMNVISEVSFQQLRLVAVGYNPGPATIAQLERMKMLAARSMEEGAWGLVARFESGGPEQPEEVLEVAKVVAKYDGIYVTHIGSEGAEQDRRARLRHSRGAGSEAAGAHLSPEDSRRRELGHDRKVSREDRSGARSRPRHHRQPVSVHRDATRLERLFPCLGARARARRSSPRC